MKRKSRSSGAALRCGRGGEDTLSLEGKPRREHEALIVERKVPIPSKAIVDASEAKSVAGVDGNRRRPNPKVAPHTEDQAKFGRTDPITYVQGPTSSTYFVFSFCGRAEAD
jgi:hypothetical protein